ncbi:hypothetical protein LEP1GSC061_1454 [Leptospira wolffii serovar Khorat str. Khorat-H2]|nr:hypothetical protein LEP1GSC061_1454 [Leptospira wolffii serovar Khorat str. Khorat-H2]
MKNDGIRRRTKKKIQKVGGRLDFTFEFASRKFAFFRLHDFKFHTFCN